MIRTKNYPLLLTQEVMAGGREAVSNAVDGYIAEYTQYLEANNARLGGVKTMRAPTPNRAWIEGVVGISVNGKAAAAASDLAAKNMNVMTNGEACGGFHPVSAEQLFDMEYWSLEQAKLGKGKPPALQGRVVMVTGGGGAIGLAITAEGAAAKVRRLRQERRVWHCACGKRACAPR